MFVDIHKQVSSSFRMIDRNMDRPRRGAVLAVAELEKVAEDFNRKAKTEQPS